MANKKVNNVNYEELVRKDFARLGHVNGNDINMHDALWMYNIKTADLCLDLFYAIEAEGKFRSMHLIREEFLDNVCTMDASLAYIAKKLPEYLDMREKVKTKIRQGVLDAKEKAQAVVKTDTNTPVR